MFRLVRYYSLASAVPIVAAAILLVVLYRHNAVNELIESIESQNVAMARSFARLIWPKFSHYLTSVSGADGAELRACQETRELHEALTTLTASLLVFKVKLHNRDGLTVYSSDPGEIGADASNTPEFLDSVRNGQSVSKLSFRHAFEAFSGTFDNRDIIERYLPIRRGDGTIVGIFELSVDATPLMNRIDRTTVRFGVGLLVILGSLYGLLSLVVWRADCIVRGQYTNLRRGEEIVKEGSIELEHDIIECTCAEETLREAHCTLERLARERTVKLETEIVERKRTEEALAEREEQLRLVANNVPVLIYYVDAERRIRFSNKEYENWYGISPDKFEGCQLREIIGDAHYREIRPHVDAALSGRSGRIESRTVFPKAGSRDIETSYVPHFGDDGGVKGIFVLINDFTEHKRIEERLRTAKEQADIANRAKSEFLATISHELLTPLNAVIGFSEMIIRETFGPVGSPKYREYAADIQLSGQHLLELITDILDLSKVEVGMMELDEEWIEIPAIIRCIVALARKRAERNSIKLEVNCPDDSPALHVDRRKLKQILINLLSNGIKFTPPGGSVTLSVWCHADSGYVFQIVDSGIGIAPEDIRKALAPFCQVDGDLSRKYEGTGLGLPLAKALVELHGGSLSIESHVDIGTTATVSLPARRIASHDATIT